MPRYFFETHDGETLRPDISGSTFDNCQLAHQDAIATLYAMSSRPLSNAMRREMWIKVLDEQGKAVAETSLTMGPERELS